MTDAKKNTVSATVVPENVKEAVRERYGEVVRLVPPDESCVLLFRRPNKGEWRRFVDASSSDRRGSSREAPMHRLALDCFIWPESEGQGPNLDLMNTILDRFPGLAATIVGELSELVGASESVDVGKL